MEGKGGDDKGKKDGDVKSEKAPPPAAAADKASVAAAAAAKEAAAKAAKAERDAAAAALAAAVAATKKPAVKFAYTPAGRLVGSGGDKAIRAPSTVGGSVLLASLGEAPLEPLNLPAGTRPPVKSQVKLSSSGPEGKCLGKRAAGNIGDVVRDDGSNSVPIRVRFEGKEDWFDVSALTIVSIPPLRPAANARVKLSSVGREDKCLGSRTTGNVGNVVKDDGSSSLPIRVRYNGKEDSYAVSDLTVVTVARPKAKDRVKLAPGSAREDKCLGKRAAGNIGEVVRDDGSSSVPIRVSFNGKEDWYELWDVDVLGAVVKATGEDQPPADDVLADTRFRFVPATNVGAATAAAGLSSSPQKVFKLALDATSLPYDSTKSLVAASSSSSLPLSPSASSSSSTAKPWLLGDLESSNDGEDGGSGKDDDSSSPSSGGPKASPGGGKSDVNKEPPPKPLTCGERCLGCILSVWYFIDWLTELPLGNYFITGITIYQFVNFIMICSGITSLSPLYSRFSGWDRYQLLFLRFWDTGVVAAFTGFLFEMVTGGLDIDKMLSCDYMRKDPRVFAFLLSLVSVIVLTPCFVTHLFPILFFLPIVVIIYCCLGCFTRKVLCNCDCITDRLEQASDKRKGSSSGAFVLFIKVVIILTVNISLISIFYHSVLAYTTSPFTASDYFGITRTWWRLTNWNCYISRFIASSQVALIDASSSTRHTMSAISYFLV